MATDDSIRAHAIAWTVRTGDPAFEDWEAFTLWLEESPAHAAAYDEVMLGVSEATDALPALPQPVNDDQITRAPRARRWYGGAAAAGLAAVLALGIWQIRGDTYSIETAPGQTRLVDLDDGGQIAVAGDTRLVLDRGDTRLVSLERGQALFTVRHDESRPFRVTVGDDTLVDIGTVFDVERAGSRLTVAVSEGAVAFNPEQQNVRLGPGQMLVSDGSQYQVASIDAAQVGEWRQGRLTFADATLAEVAEDLSRATGTPFTASAASATQRVSGSLLLAPVRDDPRSLGPLLGVGVRRDGERWEIGGK